MDEYERLLDEVRSLRAQQYSPVEIARALGVTKSEAARLVVAVARERRAGASEAASGDTDGRAVGDQTQCWVSPRWRHRLRIEGHDDWPDDAWPGDADAPADAQGSGLACVLVAVPDGHSRVSVCGYLVDTWCLGVKNALGPKRMSTRDLRQFRRDYFGHWQSDGSPIPLELAQHLVLGSVVYARSLGFEPHRDFTRARPPLGAWEGPSAVTFGMDGKPHYLDGPNDNPTRVLATLDRTVGRGGYHYTVSLDEFDGDDDGYHYTVSLTDREELREVA